MQEQHQFEYGGVTYLMTPANAMSSWQALKNALRLLQGVDLSQINSGKLEVIGASFISTALANLGDPSVKALEEIVLKHTVYQGEQGNQRLSDNPDRHFNRYRSHLIPVLMEGLKYQFGGFFSGGGELLKGIIATIPTINSKA
ncbi:hypothetical protein JFL47_07845 [Haemophilus haemoglobinophilus]|nr:hypothetical protein [Canicola haemoglobinophilus]